MKKILLLLTLTLFLTSCFWGDDTTSSWNKNTDKTKKVDEIKPTWKIIDFEEKYNSGEIISTSSTQVKRKIDITQVTNDNDLNQTVKWFLQSKGIEKIVYVEQLSSSWNIIGFELLQEDVASKLNNVNLLWNYDDKEVVIVISWYKYTVSKNDFKIKKIIVDNTPVLNQLMEKRWTLTPEQEMKLNEYINNEKNFQLKDGDEKAKLVWESILTILK